jgi:hypothetical protein
MLVPVALLSLLYAPIVGAAIGIAAVIAMLFGAVGVVGGFR